MESGGKSLLEDRDAIQINREMEHEKLFLKNASNGIGIALICYIILMVFGQDAMYAVLPMTGLAEIDGMEIVCSEAVDWSVSTLSYFLALALPFIFYIAAVKMPLGVAFPFRRGRSDLVGGSLIVGLGWAIIVSYISLFFELFLGVFHISLISPDLSLPQETWARAIYVFQVVVLAPVLEECVFRGAVMQSLRQFGDVFALFASSVVFALYHCNLTSIPYAFLMGVAIGFFVMRSGTLWTGILIHFANNAIVVILEFADLWLDEGQIAAVSTVYDIAAAISGAVVLTILAKRYKELFRFAPPRTGLGTGKKLASFVLSPAMIIAFIMVAWVTMHYIELG